MKTRQFLSVALLVAGLPNSSALADHPAVGFGAGLAGPITTIPAGTLPQGRWGIAARVEIVSFDEFSDAQLENFALTGVETHSVRNLVSPSLGIAYGITDQLTFSARFPYVSRSDVREGELVMGVPDVHNHGSPRGAGDITALAQYSLRNPVAEGIAFSALVGARIPVGKSEVTTSDGELYDAEHQPGSGSFDPILGISATLPVDNISVDANILFTLANEGSQDVDLGDILNYNLSLAYRFEGGANHGANAPQHSHYSFDLILEANGEWRDQITQGGIVEENSGGSILFLSPGVRFSTESNFSVFVSAGIPIQEDANGIQHDTNLRAQGGVGIGF